MAQRLVTKSITAQNTFSDSVEFAGTFSLSLSGTWEAVVFLQRSFDSGSNWMDVESFEANTEKTCTTGEKCLYRVGVKTGGYTSGTIATRLGQ